MTDRPQVAAYIRISEPRAVERWSLPAQRDAIEAHCRRQGCGEPAWYVEEGRSAIADDPEKRPRFRQLLADAEARRFSVVLVVDLDRFSRSTLAALTAASRLEKAGCRIVSLNQPGDFSTPDGELMFTLHASVARYESRQKGRRVKAAIAKMRAEGKHYGSLPFGGALDACGRLVVDPERAGLLARILRDVAASSYNAVARALTAEGIPTPGSRRDPVVPYSGHWWPSMLSQLVRNGSWLADQPEPWPSLWLAAVGRARMPKIRGDRTPRMLTGLMRCRCGATLTYGMRRKGTGRVPASAGVGAGAGHYAQCFSRRKRPGGSGCAFPHTYTDTYERQVLDQLAALPDPDPRRAEAADAPGLAAWQRLKADRQAVWRARYHEHMLDEEEYQAEVRALNAREAALPRLGRAPVGVWDDFPRLRAAIPRMNPPDQNESLRSLILYVAIDGHTATVVWLPEIRQACGLPEPEERGEEGGCA